MKKLKLTPASFFIIMAINFIPGSNKNFNPWQLNFVEQVNANKASWNWTTEIDDEWKLLTITVGKKKLRYDKAWLIVSSKKFDHGDEAELIESRKDYESGDKKNTADTSIRIFVNRYIRYNPLVTTKQKIDMGLIVADEVKTPTQEAEERKGSSETVGSIKGIKHLMHLNEVLTIGVKSRAKGKGVDAIEVHMVLKPATQKDAPPTNEFVLDGEVARGLYPRYFDPTEEGLRAWYISRKRFKGKKKTYGPFSKPWSGLIS
jgi:hypothetical protein